MGKERNLDKENKIRRETNERDMLTEWAAGGLVIGQSHMDKSVLMGQIRNVNTRHQEEIHCRASYLRNQLEGNLTGRHRLNTD